MKKNKLVIAFLVTLIACSMVATVIATPVVTLILTSLERNDSSSGVEGILGNYTICGCGDGKGGTW